MTIVPGGRCATLQSSINQVLKSVCSWMVCYREFGLPLPTIDDWRVCRIGVFRFYAFHQRALESVAFALGVPSLVCHLGNVAQA